MDVRVHRKVGGMRQQPFFIVGDHGARPCANEGFVSFLWPPGSTTRGVAHRDRSLILNPLNPLGERVRCWIVDSHNRVVWVSGAVHEHVFCWLAT